MSYVVLARKWRPTSFEDLVGQEHVARTLANAIASGRIAHAFLFTGVRGVGKTTSARLLARALNCMGKTPRAAGEPDPGPTAVPCLECPACREITQGTDVDVREIDGASYNGVDEVRKLQDSLPYRPTRDRYKVFIIDEVHMLSQSAWNAFLKTLEEPPPHVKFIFATTEVHKVPVTILSRVQRFDFKLIPTRLIVDRLRVVLKAEGVAADEVGLSIIARQAAGSMRDAMSLLDQVIAWNDQQFDGDSVARVLGVASRKILHELAASLVDGKATESLRVIDQVSHQGFDLAHVARDFLELLRDLVVAKLCGEADDLLDLPDEEMRDVQALAERATPDDLLRLYHGFSAGFDDVLRGAQPRGALEMLLLRLCRRPPLLPLDELVGRLASLERRLASGGQTQGPHPSPSAPRHPAPTAPPHVTAAASRPRPREARSSPTHASVSGRHDVSADGDGDGDGDDDDLARKVHALEESPAVAEPTATEAGASSAPSQWSDQQAMSRSDSVVERRQVRTNAPGRESPTSHRSATKPKARIPGPEPETSQLSSETHEAELMAVWQELVERITKIRPDIAAILEHAVLLESGSNGLVVGWPDNSVFSGQFDDALITGLIHDAQVDRGESVGRVSIMQNDPRVRGRDTLASREIADRTLRYRQEQARLRNHPRVKDILEVLGGRVVSVKLADH